LTCTATVSPAVSGDRHRAAQNRAYTTSGRLTHGGETWLYEKFSGRVGNSDIAGTLQFDTSGQTALHAWRADFQAAGFRDLGRSSVPARAPSLRPRRRRLRRRHRRAYCRMCPSTSRAGTAWTPT
jgi:hypothetical protein